ncbi:MAG: acetyl-coenzyme A synthetase, partial [Acidobacteriota bacterium]|nr:acetyl-coenzyme A synthetase [Acidobacteriota bacterium]
MAEEAKQERDKLEALLEEKRVYPPPEAFRKQANLVNSSVIEQAAGNPEEFWAAEAANLHWFKRWDKVLEWKAPEAKWFLGGKLNVTYNCVDRHAASSRRNKAAIIWEGEPGDSRV